MNQLKPLTMETAPQGSKDTLANIQKGFGFIPNLMATFANSPAVLNGYMGLDAAWGSSSLSPVERQVILLTTSVENRCRYCTAAHSTLLKGMMKGDRSLVRSIRNREKLQDPKLNALVQLTRDIVTERGKASEIAQGNFLKEGYTPVAMMEVLVGVALKTISNYLDHLNPTPIEDVFAAESQD